MSKQDHKPIRPGEELDWPRLETYLRAELPELTRGELAVSQFHGGHANLTYLLRFGERELVLRRPPFGKIAPGAHDMQREYRVLHGLSDHFAPAPAPYLSCTDHAIIGSDFIVMERRTGIVVRDRLPTEFADVDQVNQRLTDALMRVCADLHRVDAAAAKLQDLGKPDGFAQRQLRGWEKRWNLAKTQDNPDMDRLMAALQEDVPVPQRVSIVHGDLKFDNCQFQPGNPDRVTSVFDWDMATLGDPLFDLAGLLSYWPEDDPEDMPLVLLHGDWPKKEYLKEKYAAYSGFDLARMGWYEAFGCYKSAVILQQLFARYAAGQTKDARMAKFGAVAEAFARLGMKKIS